MEHETLSNLLCKVQNFISEQNYCKSTRFFYRTAMKQIKLFYEENGISNYSSELSWECVLKYRHQYETGEISYSVFQHVWKIYEMLEETYSKGKVIRHRSLSWNAEKTPDLFVGVIEKYKQYRREQGCSANTIRGEQSEIRQFLRKMQEIGYTDLSQMQRKDISEYIISIAPNRVSGVSDSLTRLRAFFRYLIEIGKIPETLLATLQLKTAVHKKVHMGFTTEEANRIIDVIDRTTPVGKRDYAILLLARHTGLRAIDVTNLKLNDVNWHKNEISIVQHKTQRPLILPLENIVGNAIADYILNARPKSDSNYIFLRTRAPYEPLGFGNGTAIVRRYAERAQVSLPLNGKRGFHSFRRTIGVNMLYANVPLTTISEVLGHSSCDSTKPYLSIAVDSLRICAMPLTGMECTRKELL